MSQVYYQQPYNYDNNNSEYIQRLVSQEVNKYKDQGRVQNAYYNPKTGYIHVTTESTEHIGKDIWNNSAKVCNYEVYKQLKAKNAAGQINNDQAQYNYYMPEFQDQALRFYEEYKAKGAAVITSTEFPQVSVTTVSQALLNRQELVAQKYNLLGVPEKLTVSDTIDIVYPEYNDTTLAVRVGYKENEAIDTTGFGAFTQTSVSLKKAGAGLAFTEEYYMKQFSVDMQPLIIRKIALDFIRARYSRILAKLPNLTDLTGTDWAAYTAGNLQSTNRPIIDLNAARLASNSDKIGTVNTIVTNEKQFLDFYSNTWVKGLFGAPDSAFNRDPNGIVANPAQIPWCTQWIINEDIANDKAYVFDSRFIVDIEGPRKTQQINTYNPDQTVFIQKEWFDIVTPSLRTGWGRELVSI